MRLDQRADQDCKLGDNEENLGGRGEGELGNQPLLSPVRRSVRPPNSPPASQR